MFTASNIHYEISERDRGIAHGGIGAMRPRESARPCRGH
jgi:hypothetical protein